MAASKRSETVTEIYKVNAAGLITNPGRFEGQSRYVPHFWQIYLDGFADRDDGRVLGFDVTPEDKALFPELRRRRTVRLVQDEQGFIMEI